MRAGIKPSTPKLSNDPEAIRTVCGASLKRILNRRFLQLVSKKGSLGLSRDSATTELSLTRISKDPLRVYGVISLIMHKTKRKERIFPITLSGKKFTVPTTAAQQASPSRCRRKPRRGS